MEPCYALPTDALIRVVIGPRRAGKTVLAASFEGAGYLNFDDVRLRWHDIDQLVGECLA